jgi:hypothetical protein
VAGPIIPGLSVAPKEDPEFEYKAVGRPVEVITVHYEQRSVLALRGLITAPLSASSSSSSSAKTEMKPERNSSNTSTTTTDTTPSTFTAATAINGDAKHIDVTNDSAIARRRRKRKLAEVQVITFIILRGSQCELRLPALLY